MTILPKPKGRQKEVVFLPPRDHTVVLGTAGSGKTTMAIHRAINLQKHHTEAGEKTLLVTFNKMLVTYMKSFEASLPVGLVIENYHKTARGFLNKRRKMPWQCILNKKTKLIKLALEEIKEQYDEPILKRSPSLFYEEIKWIQQFGIHSLEEYIDVERVGRSGKGTRIERSNRPYLWKVYEKYLELRQEEGKLYDWDDIGLALESELINDNSDWIYQHIIIDESQDFSPTMLRSLAVALPSNGSLTLFGDVAQQIYGVRVSWKSAGLNVSKIWEFQENYRNTKEISQLALALSEMPFFEEEPDLVTPNSPKAEGPKPVLVKFPDLHSQVNTLINVASENAKTQTVGILTRARGQRMVKFLQGLKQKGTQFEELHPKRGNWSEEPGIWVGTYKAAKGLEFDTVFMPYCEKDLWPNKERSQEVGIDEACSEDARLLYVGITRARTQLIISFTDEVTQLLPRDLELYNYQEPKYAKP